MDKKIIKLSIACTVLLVTWLVGIITSPEARSARAQSAAFDITLDKGDVTRIEFDRITLERKNNKWYRILEDNVQVPSRTERIDALFENIENLRGVRKVAETSEEVDSFGLGVIARKLSMYNAGDELLISFSFGLPVAGFKAVYATSSVQPGVLSISDELAFYAQQGESYWTDLRMFPERPSLEAIERIEFETGDDSFALVQVDNPDTENVNREPFIWVIEDDPEAKLDQMRAEGIARTIINLEGSKISVDAPEGEPLASATAQVVGTTYTIQVYPDPEEEESFIANPSLENQGYYYTISENVRERLIRDREYFIIE